MKRNLEHPIRTLDELPETGLVLVSDFCTRGADRRVVPCSAATWRRRQKTGEAPPPVFFFGRLANHAEHVRAVVLGQDWRTVKLPSTAA